MTRSGNGSVSENQAAIAASYEATCAKASRGEVAARVERQGRPSTFGSRRAGSRTGRARSRPRPSGSSSPRRAPSPGRRCRCCAITSGSGTPRRIATDGTDRGCRRRGRSARSRRPPASACRRRGRGGRGWPRAASSGASSPARRGAPPQPVSSSTVVTCTRRRPGTPPCRGRDDLDAELGEPRGERRQAALVADRYEGALDAHKPSRISRTACGRSRCSTSWIRRSSSTASPSYGTSTASCLRIGPLSTCSSTTCTVTPVSARRGRARRRSRSGRERREQRRMHVHDPARESVEERRREDPHVPGEHDELGAVLVRGMRPSRPRRSSRSPGRRPVLRDRRRAPGPARDDARHVDVRGVDQRLEVRALAGDEHPTFSGGSPPRPRRPSGDEPRVPPRSSASSATSVDSDATTARTPGRG